MTRSEELFERAVNRIPGGVNSPVRALLTVQRDVKYTMWTERNIQIISAPGDR